MRKADCVLFPGKKEELLIRRPFGALGAERASLQTKTTPKRGF